VLRGSARIREAKTRRYVGKIMADEIAEDLSEARAWRRELIIRGSSQ
jgi:hypothetical protein